MKLPGIPTEIVEMIEDGPFEGIEAYILEQENKEQSHYINYKKLTMEKLLQEANMRAKCIVRILKDLKEVFIFAIVFLIK